MAKFDSFQEIIAWQRAYALTLQIYELTSNGSFAKDFGLKDQIRRSTVSIMANVAEGHGRRSNSEFANFLNVARGSAAETQSHLFVAVGLNYIEREEFEKLYHSLEEVSKMTLSLAKYLRASDAR